MTRTDPTVQQVLSSARQTLSFALLGERDFNDLGDRRLSGFHNAVIHGRSVTFVLQKLKGRANGYSEWYEEIQGRLKNDGVARWFVDLRNMIEKQGTHGASTTSIHIEYMDDHDMQNIEEDAPPNTVRTFLGDSLGRSGWEVLLDDGSITEVYFKLPSGIGSTQYLIQNAPGNEDTVRLLRHWLQSLNDIVDEAEERFSAAT